MKMILKANLGVVRRYMGQEEIRLCFSHVSSLKMLILKAKSIIIYPMLEYLTIYY